MRLVLCFRKVGLPRLGISEHRHRALDLRLQVIGFGKMVSVVSGSMHKFVFLGGLRFLSLLMQKLGLSRCICGWDVQSKWAGCRVFFFGIWESLNPKLYTGFRSPTSGTCTSAGFAGGSCRGRALGFRV